MNPLLEEKSGEHQKTGSAILRQLSSSDENWLAEQWLISAGVVPDSSIDTLLMFAYSQKGVLHNGVTIEIDRDDSNNGANPSVTYKIKLEPIAKAMLKTLKQAERRYFKSTILKKAYILGLVKLGAPYQIEDTIKALAVNYLPKKYKVEVQILE